MKYNRSFRSLADIVDRSIGIGAGGARKGEKNTPQHSLADIVDRSIASESFPNSGRAGFVRKGKNIHQSSLADIVDRSIGIDPPSEPFPDSGRPESIEKRLVSNKKPTQADSKKGSD